MLAFYLDRTKSFRSSSQQFVIVTDRIQSPLKESRYRFPPAYVCYSVAIVTTLAVPSMRSQASSVAFLAQIPIQDFFRAATWSYSFASHCAISQQARDHAKFGRVLQSLFR